LKEQIILVLEVENITPPSRSWWSMFIRRLIADRFRICHAQPLEQDCYQLTPADVAKDFHCLNSLSISEYDLHLVINLDETGFAASKNGRLKSGTVPVPTAFEKRLFEKKYLNPILFQRSWRCYWQGRS
jgi:hypothetical protein